MKILERRSAGLLVPLFSLRNEADWGIGEYRDLAAAARWAKRGGFSLVMTLPLYEPAPGMESPYSACSFFALDPLYLALDQIAEVRELGADALVAAERRELSALRGAPAVMHMRVRALKEAVLRRAHARFVAAVARDASRAAPLRAFEAEHAHWLADYALFRALKTVTPSSFRDWAEPIRTRTPAALAEAKATLGAEIAFRTWLQLLCFEQLENARRECNESGVALGGDEPFLVADDSAEVWARASLFRQDATVGAPPDAFSADGQDWGLPPYRWDRMADTGYELFAQRGRHAARIYDMVRIDHVVGLYRTYHRPLDGSPHYFLPEGEAAQKAQGEALLRALRAGGIEVIAEDLGVIPDFVRHSLGALQTPGYRVLRWEQEHGRFRDPAGYPELSVATNGTHDTESSWEWWDGLPEWERAALAALPELSKVGPKARFGEPAWEALLRTVFTSASRLALIPIGDLLALRERVNTPNTVGPENWSWRLPWTQEALAHDAIVNRRLEFTATLASDSGRAKPQARRASAAPEAARAARS